MVVIICFDVAAAVLAAVAYFIARLSRHKSAVEGIEIQNGIGVIKMPAHHAA
jgi:hypothetical protein